MRAVKPINPINKKTPVDPFLLERIKIVSDEIQRGEVYSLEEVFAEILNLIEEKKSSNNAKKISYDAETLATLQVIALGRKEVQLGRTKPLKQAFAEVRKLMKEK